MLALPKDLSVQFVLPRRAGDEAGEEAAGEEAAGRTHSSPPSSQCQPKIPTAPVPGPPHPDPPWASSPCSRSLPQPQTWPGSVLHLGKAFFNLDKLLNLNANPAAVTAGSGSRPGRMRCGFVTFWGAHSGNQLQSQRNLVFQTNHHFPW